MKQFKLCSCNGTVDLDAGVLEKALQLDAPVAVHCNLCRRDAGALQAALQGGDEVLVACTQEAALFGELADELGAGDRISFVNVREAGGWSREGARATPKLAALLAAARLPAPEPVPGVSYKSEGRLLVVGNGRDALFWAEQLAEQLDVSVLLTESRGSELPALRRYPIFSGRVQSIEGYLGNFQVSWAQENPIDLEVCTRCNACIRTCPENAIGYDYQIDPDKCRSHRACVAACEAVGAIDFARADARRSETFDLVLDLSDAPLLTLPQPPQGYFAPGGDPRELARALSRLPHLVGEFEKPKFFNYKANKCAHGRSRVIGCNQCVDLCSARAISPDGNYVKVEPHLCMGCGACASTCPSGAMSYAVPRVAELGMRLKTLLGTYAAAGGRDACLLFHNGGDGRELVARLARRGAGLPARVIPQEVFHIASIGIDVLLGAVARGAGQVAILATGGEAPDYREMLIRQMEFAEAIMNGLGYRGSHFRLLTAATPEALESAVWELAPAEAPPPATFALTDDKRTTLDLALDHLFRHAPAPCDEVALAEGAPFGAIEVDRDACTLCLACVGACPAGALLDSRDVPRLKFIERNCVQCGLCAKTCPENAITLAPRLLLTAEARRERVVSEAEIFPCIRCGKPLGTKPMIDRMLGRLANHSMFAGGLDRIKMCADCRVVDMMSNRNEQSIFDVTR